MTVDELKLLLTSAQIAFEEEKQTATPSLHWSDWWESYIQEERPDFKDLEIAILLREGDSLYDLNKEQGPYILFLAQHVQHEIEK